MMCWLWGYRSRRCGRLLCHCRTKASTEKHCERREKRTGSFHHCVLLTIIWILTTQSKCLQIHRAAIALFSTPRRPMMEDIIRIVPIFHLLQETYSSVHQSSDR
jgi:hypothetical protein